jgi:hypothetical protein
VAKGRPRRAGTQFAERLGMPEPMAALFGAEDRRLPGMIEGGAAPSIEMLLVIAFNDLLANEELNASSRKIADKKPRRKIPDPENKATLSTQTT